MEEEPILLTFEEPWVNDPFKQRYRITKDLGKVGEDKTGIYKFKIEKV